MQIMEKTHFEAFRKALTLKPDDIIDMIEKANLVGRGGAHFPTATKWKFTKNAKGSPKFIICNFDEGEPGTFKDKFIADHNPELIIEGIAINAYAIGAKKAFIYLRGEYAYLKPILEEITQKYWEEIKKIDLTIEISLEVFLGAGAYICGDETSIMNSIEGIRPEPRAKPPYPAQSGLWGCPTSINNVETLANVPLILISHWEERGWQKLRLYSLSGNVQKPGIYELPEGITMKQLIQKGKPTKPIKALFFGCAGGCLPYRDDFILSVQNVADHGAMFGSSTIIAVDVDQSIPLLCKNIAEFFVHESCGKCVPCREGTIRMLELLKDIPLKNIALIKNLVECMEKASFCGLGQTAALHIKTALKYFEEEFV
jgi:NADH:ubiquinone oxidoreductase subunit F (NADH-binding)